MSNLSVFFTVALLHFLAVISPGPDFMMITRNSLIYSRRAGIFSAIGLGLGILVHVAYSLLGIALIISQSPILFNIIKILGAFYLIYIGFKSLFSRSSLSQVSKYKKVESVTDSEALKIGFITNITNPKATLFFLSLFTIVITPTTPLWLKLILAVEMSLVTFVWFTFIAFVFSHPIIRSRIDKIQHYAERIIGIILILLGAKIAISG